VINLFGESHFPENQCRHSSEVPMCYDGNYFQAIEFSCSGSIWVILLMIFTISSCCSILSSLRSFPVLCLCSPFAMAFLKWKLYPKMNYLYFPAYLKKWWANQIFLTKILMGQVYANFFFNNLNWHFDA
jgi:hypothetical protein